MCDSLADKCNPYIYAPQSMRDCDKGNDFYIFNCQQLPFETFLNYDESDMRCLIEKLPETTTPTPDPSRTTASNSFLRPAPPSPRSSSRTLTRPVTRRPNTPTPSTTEILLTSVSSERTTPTVSTRDRRVQASFIAYRDCVQQRVTGKKFFYNICEWIRMFIRWRWRTFKTWSTYTRDISLDLYELPQKGSCWANIRGCRNKNQRRCLTDLHGCRYCYCEIYLDDTYDDILTYYYQDMDYWTHRLYYQWIHLMLNYDNVTLSDPNLF